MPSVSSIALAHQDRLLQINRTGTTRLLRLWKQMDFDQLDASWVALEPQMVAQVDAAQLAAARTSDGYTAKLSAEYRFAAAPDQIIPESFVGIDGSGRSTSTLLHGSVTTTKQAVGAGMGRTMALEAGAAFLATMFKTALNDIGRSSDLVSATAKGYTRYVRVINPGACSRCAILAGISSYKTAFKRHPACRCTTAAIPESGGSPAGLFGNSDDYFDSLSEAEQDRVFTKSGAEAIRSGASIQSVVSARRGATGITTSRGIGRGTTANSGRRLERVRIGTDGRGDPVFGYVTSEGTTRRGEFGRRQQMLGGSERRLVGDRYTSTSRVRLMPETIVSLTDDPAVRRVLLRDAGYINLDSRLSAVERAAQAASDREWAERVYRARGITLG